MTTPEPERDDPAALQRDDALLDAVASGSPGVPGDDPAAALLAEIARAVEEPTSGGSEGDGGGPRHVRTIWGVTLGVSVALALGGGLGVAAYGQLSPQSAAAQTGFIAPPVPTTAAGLGGVTVTVPSGGPGGPLVRDASWASEFGPALPEVDGWPWQFERDAAPAQRQQTDASRTDTDRTGALAITRWAGDSRTYSVPVPSSAAPAYREPSYPAPTSSPAPTRSTTYVPNAPAESSTPSTSPTGRDTPEPTSAPSTASHATAARSARADSAHGAPTTSPRGGGGVGAPRSGRR